MKGSEFHIKDVQKYLQSPYSVSLERDLEGGEVMWNRGKPVKRSTASKEKNLVFITLFYESCVQICISQPLTHSFMSLEIVTYFKVIFKVFNFSSNCWQ